MNEIRMIPIGDLEHHPENPRKDLGDLTELTESIRANGILQNLTVVADPERNRYLVVIGNRRYEAARAAGLKELPCVISDMDHRTQIATMLEENMQRSDLTAYEQAQGFQMMMDLGFTEAEISEKTGFSRTTVSRRLKMAELDGELFKKAIGKQITMDDLDKLGQIRSIKQRNALLMKYGENNYDWEVNRAIRLQKAKEKKPKVMALIREAKIPKLPDKDRYSGKYQRHYNLTVRFDEWQEGQQVVPKMEDIYYLDDEMEVEFYQKEKKTKAAPVQKSEAERAEEKRVENAWKIAERMTRTAGELRKAYAMDKMNVTPSNAMQMLRWTLIAAMCMMFDYDTPSSTLRKTIPLGNYIIQENLEAVFKWLYSMPQRKWPALIQQLFEGDTEQKKCFQGYVDGVRYRMPQWKKNKKLDMEYLWLREFGYTMSEEEEQLQMGTHYLFQKEFKGEAAG